MERPLPPIKLEEYKPPTLWGTKAELPIIAYMIFGFILALILPTDVLSTHSNLSKFSDWMASIIPSINSISSISSFPEVTKFFFATMWFLAPVVLVVYLLKKPLPEKKFRRKEIFYIAIGIPVFLLIVYKILTETGFSTSDLTYAGGRGRAFLAMFSQNRLALALIGTWLPTGVIFMVWIVIVSFSLPVIRFIKYFSTNRH